MSPTPRTRTSRSVMCRRLVKISFRRQAEAINRNGHSYAFGLPSGPAGSPSPEPAAEEARHHGRKLLSQEDEVAHPHRVVTHLLECSVGAERTPHLDRHA